MKVGYKYIFGFSVAMMLIAMKSYGQLDTLTFDNGEIVVGEIKSLNRGVLAIETAFSDSDFLIEWDAVRSIRSSRYYLITISDGRRLNASINSSGDGSEVIMMDGMWPHTADLDEIINFKPINATFWDKFSASVDLGLNHTKANNLTQFNSNLALGYLTKRWEANAAFNRVFSRQDSIQDTRRTQGTVKFTVFLQKDWFIYVSNDFLQNDEQKLALRSTTKLALGRYVIDNQELYLALSAGATSNNELYTENANPNRFTGEAFAGVEFNMFDAGDISLLTNVKAYPNLTDLGRIRIDFAFNIKYDLPKDFYIKMSTTVNYDNSPVEGASDVDYVIQSGIGWEW